MDVTQSEEIREGEITRTIEEQTAKIPSINWLGLAAGSMVASFIAAIVFKRRGLGTFIGLWAPSLMLIGVYNKIVKLEAGIERNRMH